MKSVKETKECCPKFDPEPWENKTLEWDNKLFIKEKVRTVFFMPLNFGSAIRRAYRKVTAAGGEMTDWLCLSDHTSGWNMDIYISVDREIPDADNVKLSGTFYSKVYEGPFKETGNWCKDYANIVKSKGLNIVKMFMWYTTCPKCSKKWGKNYVVIISKVENSN